MKKQNVYKNFKDRVIHYLLNLQNLSFANIAKITPTSYFPTIIQYGISNCAICSLSLESRSSLFHLLMCTVSIYILHLCDFSFEWLKIFGRLKFAQIYIYIYMHICNTYLYWCTNYWWIANKQCNNPAWFMNKLHRCANFELGLAFT